MLSLKIKEIKMKLAKVGTKVILRSTGEYGSIIGVNDTKVHVKLDDGRIVNVVRDAIIVIGLLDRLWKMVRGLVRDIVDTFKGKYDER